MGSAWPTIRGPGMGGIDRAQTRFGIHHASAWPSESPTCSRRTKQIGLTPLIYSPLGSIDRRTAESTSRSLPAAPHAPATTVPSPSQLFEPFSISISQASERTNTSTRPGAAVRHPQDAWVAKATDGRGGVRGGGLRGACTVSNNARLRAHFRLK
jgi:hypothetical protein